MKADQNS